MMLVVSDENWTNGRVHTIFRCTRLPLLSITYTYDTQTAPSVYTQSRTCAERKALSAARGIVDIFQTRMARRNNESGHAHTEKSNEATLQAWKVNGNIS